MGRPRKNTQLQEIKAEALWQSYDRLDAERLAARIGVRGGDNAIPELKNRLTCAYRQFNIACWDSKSSAPVNEEEEEGCCGRDTLCFRCAAVSGRGSVSCPWAARLTERDDWTVHSIKAHTVNGGSIRVEDCPAFQLCATGRKDKAVVILALGCVFGAPGMLDYWRCCSYNELNVWVGRYNKVLKELGAGSSDLIELRPFSGIDETWRMCRLGTEGKISALLAR